MKETKTILIVTSVLMLGALLYALFRAGLPPQARAQKFDEERERDLSSIKNSIQTYVFSNNVLPNSLETLTATYSYLREQVKDPQTGQPYEYSADITRNSYTLCAQFGTDSMNESSRKPSSVYLYDFAHPKGHHCFTFTVQTKGAQVLTVPSTLPQPGLENNFRR